MSNRIGQKYELAKTKKEIVGVIIGLVILVIISTLIQQGRESAYERGFNHEPLDQGDQYQDNRGW